VGHIALFGKQEMHTELMVCSSAMQSLLCIKLKRIFSKTALSYKSFVVHSRIFRMAVLLFFVHHWTVGL
jgi:hypothetical protein